MFFLRFPCLSNKVNYLKCNVINVQSKAQFLFNWFGQCICVDSRDDFDVATLHGTDHELCNGAYLSLGLQSSEFHMSAPTFTRAPYYFLGLYRMRGGEESNATLRL